MYIKHLYIDSFAALKGKLRQIDMVESLKAPE